MIRTRLVLCLIATILPWSAHAQMYLPFADKLPQEEMSKIGIKKSPEEIAALAKGAVLRLPASGCTATFLSEEGLIGTNHHCAEGCREALGDKALKEGFLAKNRQDETACPGQTIRITEEVRNISEKLLPILRDSSLGNTKDRTDAVKAKIEDIRAECRNKDPNIACDVWMMNNEEQPYLLYKYKVLKDVRLVWSPSLVVGKFGGDLDNWNYPRHTGDFSFIRAYDNGKPYHSANYAHVSGEGFHAGDAVFVLGFPGRSERNITAATAHFLQNVQYPINADFFSAFLKTIRSRSAFPSEGPYAGPHEYFANYAENFHIKSRLMAEMGVINDKLNRETQVKDPQYIEKIAALMRDRPFYYPTVRLIDLMTDFPNAASKGLKAANTVYKWISQPQDDKKREEAYKLAAHDDLRDAVVGDDKHQPVFGDEKALLATFFALADQLTLKIRTVEELKQATRTLAQRCFDDRQDTTGLYERLCTGLNPSIYKQMAEVLLVGDGTRNFPGTQMLPRTNKSSDVELAQQRRGWLFSLNMEELLRQNDSLIFFAKGLIEDQAAIAKDPNLAGPYTAEYEVTNFEQNLLTKPTSPDANLTMRFTLGKVQSYDPTYSPEVVGQHFDYSTTVGSMIASDDSNPIHSSSDPDYPLFIVPDAIRAAHAHKDDFLGRKYYDNDLKDIPVNFISTTIITGGNSGSSIYNANGEVLGFVFDGNPESILSDITLHPQGRTIAVDMRYIAFLGDEIYPEARWIIHELGLPTYEGPPKK